MANTHRSMPIHAATTVIRSYLAIGTLSHRPAIWPAGTSIRGSMAMLQPRFLPPLSDIKDMIRITRMIALHSKIMARLLFYLKQSFQRVVKQILNCGVIIRHNKQQVIAIGFYQRIIQPELFIRPVIFIIGNLI